MNKILLTTVMLAVSFIGSSQLLFADEEYSGSARGIVVGIDLTANTLMVHENTGSEKDKSSTYLLGPETKFENIESASGISVGDEVTFSYTEFKDGKQLVNSITAYKASSNEEQGKVNSNEEQGKKEEQNKEDQSKEQQSNEEQGKEQ